MERQFYVYILTNPVNTVLYTGFTNNLLNRVHQHRTKAVPGFTARYNVSKLVYYEVLSTAYEGIAREKRIKGGSRADKIALVNSTNPEWRDLFDELTG